MQKYITVKLNQYFNNNGISSEGTNDSIGFTGMGSFYPGEQLPQVELVTIENVPFKFPSTMDKYDNMEFYNQKIKIQKDKIKALHLLGAADNGSFTESLFLNGGKKKLNSKELKVGFTDWTRSEPIYGEKVAFRCNGLFSTKSNKIVPSITTTIWYQKLIIDTEILPLEYIRFGDNPGMHLFSITIEE